MTTVALESLGCRLNQAENESLAEQFQSRGYQLVESPHEADIYVLNTCTVTHIADRKGRHRLRMARRSNPNSLIIATGCYAQRAPEELRQLGMVDLITGNADKHRLLEVVEAETGKEALAFSPHESPLARTRSLVKIQQGCNDFCSFCIVPYVRGREHSISVKQVVEEVKKRVDIGYKEVMLTGTKIGAYGQDGKNSSPLVSLIKRILAETKLKRLRLSSLQPQELTPELVKLWHDERLCRHLHIPLQSGSETVLRRMRRRYSTADYERSVSLLREAVPNIAITTDVIVGFPGESGEEFEESYSFCKGMGFTSIHVFPYSRRIGTLAAQMPEQIKPEVKKERSQRMLALAQKSAHLFREQFLGQTIPVLWERKTGEGKWSGLSDNYLRVFTESKENLTNCLFGVKIVSEHEPGLWGKLIDEEG